MHPALSVKPGLRGQCADPAAEDLILRDAHQSEVTIELEVTNE